MLFKINLNMLGSAETCFVNLMAKKGHSAATRIFLEMAEMMVQRFSMINYANESRWLGLLHDDTKCIARDTESWAPNRKLRKCSIVGMAPQQPQRCSNWLRSPPRVCEIVMECCLTQRNGMASKLEGVLAKTRSGNSTEILIFLGNLHTPQSW